MSRIVITGVRQGSKDIHPAGIRLSQPNSVDIAKRMSAEGKSSSLRSWSAENGERPNSLEQTFDDEDDLANIEILPKEDEIPYISPPMNFIRILYGASQTLLLNSDCRRKIFMIYLTKKIGVRNHITEGATLDLCNEEGKLLKIENVDVHGNINHLFQHGDTYIPCIVTREAAGCLESIEPWLKRWERLYPSFQEIFNKAINEEKEEARRKERNLAVLAAALHVDEKKDKEKETDIKSDKKRRGKLSERS